MTFSQSIQRNSKRHFKSTITRWRSFSILGKIAHLITTLLWWTLSFRSWILWISFVGRNLSRRQMSSYNSRFSASLIVSLKSRKMRSSRNSRFRRLKAGMIQDLSLAILKKWWRTHLPRTSQVDHPSGKTNSDLGQGLASSLHLAKHHLSHQASSKHVSLSRKWGKLRALAWLLNRQRVPCRLKQLRPNRHFTLLWAHKKVESRKRTLL